MNGLIRNAGLVALACASLLLPVRSVQALGFRNADQGAAATAQGEAFIVQADDASATYYNPAGLTQLTGTEVMGGSYLLFRDVKVNGVLGNDRMEKFDFLPHLYAASDLGTEDWRFGLAVNAPFGLSIDWGASGPFAFVVTEAELAVMNFAPTVAFRINDQLSIGASLNVYHGDTTLKFNYSPLLPGSLFKFEADGVGVGATVGVRWQLHEQHAVAAVFRSPFSIDLKGDAAIGNAGPFNDRASANAEFDFPMCIAVGYAFWPTDDLKLEVNVDWTHWDTLNVVRLRSPNPTFSGDPRATIPFHWEDSFFYEFGAQYRLNEQWVLRAGYIFSENTVPTATFGPLVPDSDRHVFSAGVGFQTGRLAGNLTYQYSLSEDRTIPATNPVGAGGQWESDAHAIVLTSSIRF